MDPDDISADNQDARTLTMKKGSTSTAMTAMGFAGRLPKAPRIAIPKPPDTRETVVRKVGIR